MKKALPLSALVCGTLFVLSAYARQSLVKPYLEGTVVQVDKHGPAARIPGENLSDAPMADPETYAYDIAVHVNCDTYIGRYRSWYDCVPPVFRPNQKIQLRLTRSVMYVDVPNEKEVNLNIVSKHVEHSPCEIAKR